MLNRSKDVAKQVNQQLQKFASKDTPNYTVSTVAAGIFLGVAVVSELEGAKISSALAIASMLAASASAANQYIDKYDAKKLYTSITNSCCQFFKSPTEKAPEAPLVDNAVSETETLETPKLS